MLPAVVVAAVRQKKWVEGWAGGEEEEEEVEGGKNVKAPARRALRRGQYAAMNAYYIYL